MSEQVVTPGKLVSLTYRICDDGGNLLEQNDLPVSYIHGGHSELIGDMDRAVAGKRAGDQVEMVLSPHEAFGEWDPDLTFTDELENVPAEYHFVGAEVPMQNNAGETKTFYVTRIDNGSLTIDGNHPLAGKRLHVEVRVQDVRDPTEEELMADASLKPEGALH